MIRKIYGTAFETANRFLTHDGWAVASHISLSGLMSLFPFFILIAALAGYLGAADLADEVARLLLEAWPVEIAGPIANEVRSVLTVARADALTFGAVLALYFASSGVEALRTGINRAYDAVEWRPWWRLRLESIAVVLVGAFVVLAFALLVVFAPLAWRIAMRVVPELAPLGWPLGFLRIGLALLLALGGLVLVHWVLPPRRPTLAAIWPGIVMTIVLWFLTGVGFGAYLESFSGSYVTMYAGLATAMVALVFLYAMASIFLLGAELNAALVERASPTPASPAHR